MSDMNMDTTDTSSSSALLVDGTGGSSSSLAGAPQPLFVALFALTLAHTVVALGWFVARRHTHPIRGHALGLVAMPVLALGVSALTNAQVYMGVPTTCVQDLVGSINTVTVAVITYIVRAWRIFMFYNVQTRKVIDHGNGTPQGVGVGAGERGRGATMPRTSVSDADAGEGEEGGGDVTPVGEDTNSSSAPLKTSASTPAPSRKKRRSMPAPLVKTVSTIDFGKLRSAEFYRRWCTDRNFLLAAVGLSALAVVAEWIPYLTRRRGGGSGLYLPEALEPCPELDSAQMVQLAVIGASVVFVVFTVYKLRRKYDGYLIKRELKYDAFWAVCAAATLALEGSIADNRPLQAAKIIVQNGVIFTTVTWKVAASYGLCGGVRMGRQNVAQTSTHLEKSSGLSRSGTLTDSQKVADFNNKVVKFKAILGDEKGIRLFAEHLKREWSIENLLFYQAVHVYRSMFDEDGEFGSHERAGFAVQIYFNFISHDAPSMVNLPSTLRNEVERHIGAQLGRDVSEFAHRRSIEGVDPAGMVEACVSADLFDSVATEIYSLMKRDSFVRFVGSSLYAEFLSSRNTSSAVSGASLVHRAKGQLARVFARRRAGGAHHGSRSESVKSHMSLFAIEAADREGALSHEFFSEQAVAAGGSRGNTIRTLRRQDTRREQRDRVTFEVNVEPSEK